MNVTFSYDPRKEVDTLRVGLSSQNSTKPTTFAEAAQVAGIDFTSEEEVSTFVIQQIEEKSVNMEGFVQSFTERWKPIEEEATIRFKRIFNSDWDPGEVTAYLTLSTRCPYNFQQRYYFVSVVREKNVPIQISLHELIHFYTHELIEPLFIEAGVRDRHNEFKEALSVLLNLEFSDLLDGEDKGYPQHQELRSEIADKWRGRKDVYTIAQEFIQLLS
jgi:hypothetical protein